MLYATYSNTYLHAHTPHMHTHTHTTNHTSTHTHTHTHTNAHKRIHTHARTHIEQECHTHTPTHTNIRMETWKVESKRTPPSSIRAFINLRRCWTPGLTGNVIIIKTLIDLWSCYYKFPTSGETPIVWWHHSVVLVSVKMYTTDYITGHNSLLNLTHN
jgi:hypothetical protein